MIYPPLLKEGDVVRLVSPAGVIDREFVDGAEKCLSSWGLKVITGENACNSCGRYSGTVEQRLSDLREALDDPECNAVFCTRGGYGTVHLIDKIQFDKFKLNPKWVIGYSDITMLHERLQSEGFASIHGGMARAMSKLTAGCKPEVFETILMLHDILWGNYPVYEVAPHKLNRNGSAEGNLSGGNLSILYSLRGTRYDDIPEGCILFIEDTGERPYVIDRIMNNFRLGGIFERISGLIVGQFSDYEEDPLMGKSVYEIVADAVSEYSFPVCFNFPVGHVLRNLPLISGGRAMMEVNDNGTKVRYNL